MAVTVIILVLIVVGTFLFYASYSIRSGIYLCAFCSMKTNQKIVALTFDDGPDSRQTPLVLDVLKNRSVPATFFCIGHKLTGNEEIIRRMDAERHTIGNHTYSHTGMFPLYPVRKIKEDMLQCQQELQKILNKEICLFRPPFGVTNPRVARAVKRLGYTTIGWNIRTMDTQKITHERILWRIRRRLRPGSVILLHDRIPQSELLLSKVLDLLEEEGYRVVALNEMMIS